MRPFQALLTILVFLMILTGIGGYTFIEGWNLLDAAYMTVITLSTVGFGETHDLSSTGRAFTAGLIGVSVVLMACWTAQITSVLVSGEISGSFRAKRLKRMIESIKNHTVICGCDTMALTIVHRLHCEGKPMVVIADKEHQIDVIRRTNPDVPIVQADPKTEMAMIDANVLAASNLIAAANSDFDNLLITITGKSLGTNIKVISCAQSTELASRMFKVGADEVICPFVICGERVADLITQSDAESDHITEDLKPANKQTSRTSILNAKTKIETVSG